MADILVQSSKWQFNFEFERDGETNTRTISVDSTLNSEAGLSAAKAFRDVLTGAAANPFSIIEPTTFIQPTGWRDNNPEEEPWTVTACHLVRIDSTETHYDGGDGIPARGLELRYDNSDTANPKVIIYAEDITSTNVSILNAKVYYTDGEYGTTPVTWNSTLDKPVLASLTTVGTGSIITVTAPASSSYGAAVATITIP